jgi:hypothetical protein
LKLLLDDLQPAAQRSAAGGNMLGALSTSDIIVLVLIIASVAFIVWVKWKG